MSLFGVFDGHGGNLAAKRSCVRLPEEIQARLRVLPSGTSSDTGPLSRVLQQSALRVDEELRSVRVVRSGEDRSGTTAVYTLVTPSHIITANIGDSRAILWRHGNVVPLSEDHKPSTASEAARIHRAGSSVIAGRVNGDLAVSRALGDFRFKPTGMAATETPVSPEAEVTVVDRQTTDDFVVLACDGIWDVMSSEMVGEFLSTNLETTTPEHCCEQLIQECLARGSRDNMSVLLVLLASKYGAQSGLVH
eukprot:TRINITY_DN28243_c0_g1_i1.p1 TRINITY_DN28243_c0_g1~~TRINITY_DN28243_c0_g1_i1.p1  ORF type:complete len:249 (-),score=44.82 TRINITY_DN28243_c0_g1_i1:532-1278(-)